MFSKHYWFVFVAVPAFGLAAGCNPHITVDPVNINVNAKIDITLHTAQDTLEQITGEKPAHVVRPEDLGLPAAPATQPGSGAARQTRDEVMTYPVSLANARGNGAAGAGAARAGTRGATVPIATADELKKSMAARSAEIRGLWDNKLVGETHTGLLVAKGTLTPEQEKLLAAENADRAALYAADAAAQKATVDDVALQYFVARMGYAKNGAWYEKRNPAGQWEWKQWGM